jgi:hypothetical protein
MKKLFIVLAVASLGFVSCNNDAADTEAEAKRIADSTHIADSTAKAAAEAAAAAAAATDTSKKMATDTSAKK